MPRRRGRPGLVGTMARTAVVAGTATAVHGAVSGNKKGKQAAADEQAAANQAAFDSQAQLAEMQRQQDAAAAAAAAAADGQAGYGQASDGRTAAIAFDSRVVELAEMQGQQDAAVAAAASPVAPAAAAAPAAEDDMIATLTQLADMKAAGVLTDKEFAAAKAKALGTVRAWSPDLPDD